MSFLFNANLISDLSVLSSNYYYVNAIKLFFDHILQQNVVFWNRKIV